MVEAMRRQFGTGLVMALLAAAAFGTSGPFAKSLIEEGWSPPLVVFVRMLGAALVLAPFAYRALVAHRHDIARHWPLVVAYGLLAVGLAQLGFFQAVERLPVGVALLLEFLGVVIVVLVMWVITRVVPHRLTFLGIALAIAGLVLILDVVGAARPDLVGVAWGLIAALGLAGHFVIAGRPNPLPPIAFACLGLLVGAGALAVLGVTGVLDMRVGAGEVDLLGHDVPSWVSLAELVLVAAALAYVLGILAARQLGSTMASFVGLTEVLFAILFAWLLLGELPRAVQLVGGALILGGVIAVRLGERVRELADPSQDTVEDLFEHAETPAP